ncbi:MAG: serine/threonine-protein kinase [Myxococcaceae bacterium]|nr:serine/threonine-protein kinase [Myxococcaceae bacterium]
MSDAPPSFDAELPAGSLVGSYELVERIGSGGMGDVYRARHKAIGKPAAVKVLKAERASDAKSLELFLKEATTLGALSHRNLVEVLDFGHLPNGQPFLTMAFIDGKTLYQAIQESLDATGSGLSVPTALGISEQMLSALGEAHKKGIVHRDLKPANVMLVREHTGETLVKVLDFGLSRATEGSILPWATQGSTQQSSAAGTPAYVSPEQVRNEELDGRADLYSLGCTLFEMLTGRAPFVADSPLELVKLQLEAEPPPLADFVRNVPEEVERLVLWFLQKRREDRPENADVARLEVRRLLTKLSREATTVRGPSTLPSLKRLTGEQPRFVPSNEAPASSAAPLAGETADELAPVLPRPKRRPLVVGAFAVVGFAVVIGAAVAWTRGADAGPQPVDAPPSVVSPSPVVPEQPPAVLAVEAPAPAPAPEKAAGEVAGPEGQANPPQAEPADDDLVAPTKLTRPSARPPPAPTCRWSDDFKALARKDHQTLQQLAAQRGIPRATLDALEDAFGNAMVKRDCRGALRVLDKLRRHAPSR